MKVLLDTSIIIQREIKKTVDQEIEALYDCLDKLNCSKLIHPLTLEALKSHKGRPGKSGVSTKVKYDIIEYPGQVNKPDDLIYSRLDFPGNENPEAILLKELDRDNADILISNDKKIHSKAGLTGLSDRVFTIDQFLEKAISENENLVDYRVLGIRKELFSTVDLTSSFFDSFKEDYPGFENWFKKKAGEHAYTLLYKRSTFRLSLYQN